MMKKIILCSGLLVAQLTIFAQADQRIFTVEELTVPQLATETAVAEDTQTHLFTLKNGMPLIVKPDHRAPTAVHMLWVRVGSMDEVSGTSGVAHALEHMVFKGTPTVKVGEFSRRVAALGGQENAFTASDYTAYYQQIPNHRLAEVMQLEADRFVNNIWPDDEFKREIEVVKEERRMRTDDRPRSLLYEQLMANTFIANPYHRPIIGWMNDLEHMTAEDVRHFYKQWYNPANAAVVVAGDVDPQAVLALAEQYYGQLPVAVLPERKPQVEPLQTGIRRLTVRAPAEQAYLLMAYKVPGLRDIAQPTESDWEALALTVLSAVLDGNDGARLERHLINSDKRVADTASTGNGLYGRGPQVFYVEGIPAAGKTVAELEAALRAEIRRIAEEGITDSELARVKTQWIASEVYQRDSVYYQAQEAGAYWALGLPQDTNDRLITMLRQVTAAQVQAVAKKYFGEDQLTVAVLDPQPRDPKAQSRRPAFTLRH